VRLDVGWDLDPDWIFLNHGSFGACPRDVLAVQRGLRDRMERQPLLFLDRDLPDLLAEARQHLGAFLHADPEGLAFVPNATTGVNAVLRSLRFEPGDELLTDDHEYNAVINAMRAAAERDGARVVVARIPFPSAGPDEVVEAILAGVTERTRLAVISHVTSATALILPIERIVTELAARGIDTLVDAAHAPGMVPVDIDALGAAYVTGNGHKWLCAPKGAAFLWVRPDRRTAIHPAITSHGFNDPRIDPPRYRLEFDWVGTADPTASLSLPAAIDWMASSMPGGWPAVMAANRDGALAAGRRLVEALGAPAPAPDAMIGSMVTVPLPDIATEAEAVALKRALERERIEVPVVVWPVRAGRRDQAAEPDLVAVRVSVQRYVEPSDVEALVDALARRADAA
jgi:isopenicillin-N epimerase